jgi:hypothetical protein
MDEYRDLHISTKFYSKEHEDTQNEQDNLKCRYQHA